MANQKGELLEQIWLEFQPELVDSALVKAFLAEDCQRRSGCARCKEKQMFQCRPNRHFEETFIRQAAPGRASSGVRPARFSLIICGFLSLLSLSDFPSCAPTSVALQSN